MKDFAYEANVKQYTVNIKTVRQVVEEFLDTYDRSLLGTKQAEALIAELEKLNN